MIELRIGGSRFSGWTSFEITRSIDTIADTFMVSYVDRWAAMDEAWVIEPDSTCSVYLDDELVIDGYVVSVGEDVTAEQFQLQAEGYGRAGILTKAHAVHQTGQWRGAEFETIVADLLTPYGVAADFRTLVPDVIQRFELEDGEPVAASMERLCLMMAVIMTSNPDGSVRFWRMEDSDLGHSLGSRPLQVGLRRDFSQRHSSYIAKGQVAGTDEFFADVASLQRSSEIVDPGVTLYSPMLLHAEGPGGGKYLHQRAVWERNVRGGRGETIQVTYPGARDLEGQLWQVGAKCSFRYEPMGLDAQGLVVAEVSHSLDLQSGLVSTLTLMSQSAFSLLELPQRLWQKRTGKR